MARYLYIRPLYYCSMIYLFLYSCISFLLLCFVYKESKFYFGLPYWISFCFCFYVIRILLQCTSILDVFSLLCQFFFCSLIIANILNCYVSVIRTKGLVCYKTRLNPPVSTFGFFHLLRVFSFWIFVCVRYFYYFTFSYILHLYD